MTSARWICELQSPVWRGFSLDKSKALNYISSLVVFGMLVKLYV